MPFSIYLDKGDWGFDLTLPYLFESGPTGQTVVMDRRFAVTFLETRAYGTKVDAYALLLTGPGTENRIVNYGLQHRSMGYDYIKGTVGTEILNAYGVTETKLNGLFNVGTLMEEQMRLTASSVGIKLDEPF